MDRKLLHNSSILRPVVDRVNRMSYTLDDLLEEMKTYPFINELVQNGACCDK